MDYFLYCQPVDMQLLHLAPVHHLVQVDKITEAETLLALDVVEVVLDILVAVAVMDYMAAVVVVLLDMIQIGPAVQVVKVL
jgi:hypothetical protein